jgi:hypothetical protein
MPEKFPATFTDFLQRVVGEDDPEKKFAAFARLGVEKFFANLQLSPEQREQGIESWTERRLEEFRQHGFPDAVS